MCCLQLAAIFCCVAIGNGNVLKRALLGPAVCVYGKQLTFVQLTRDGRLLLLWLAIINVDFCLLSTTRRCVWKNRDDVDLLVNGSQYLSHALVDLSAFVNVLSREVHAMWESRHVRIMVDWVDQVPERSREEF